MKTSGDCTHFYKVKASMTFLLKFIDEFGKVLGGDATVSSAKTMAFDLKTKRLYLSAPAQGSLSVLLIEHQ